MELFREIYTFLAKFTRKHLCWSLILIKLKSVSSNFTEFFLQHRCFLVNFVRYLRHLFERTRPGDYFCSTEKIFYQQNSKESCEKREKIETACKKNNQTGKTKTWSLFTSILLILLLFKNVFISFFSASYDLLKEQDFRNNAIPLRIIYYRKLFINYY